MFAPGRGGPPCRTYVMSLGNGWGRRYTSFGAAGAYRVPSRRRCAGGGRVGRCAERVPASLAFRLAASRTRRRTATGVAARCRRRRRCRSSTTCAPLHPAPIATKAVTGDPRRRGKAAVSATCARKIGQQPMRQDLHRCRSCRRERHTSAKYVQDLGAALTRIRSKTRCSTR